MYLSYNFDVETDVMSEYQRGYEPRTERGIINVDYDFYVDPTFDDFQEFIDQGNPLANDKRHIMALLYIWEKLGGDISFLEDDDEFIEFMTERYEDEAFKRCQDEYE